METDANLVYDHLWIEGICPRTKLSQRGLAQPEKGSAYLLFGQIFP